jgi:hypothetical protein
VGVEKFFFVSGLWFGIYGLELENIEIRDLEGLKLDVGSGKFDVNR